MSDFTKMMEYSEKMTKKLSEVFFQERAGDDFIDVKEIHENSKAFRAALSIVLPEALINSVLKIEEDAADISFNAVGCYVSILHAETDKNREPSICEEKTS